MCRFESLSALLGYRALAESTVPVCVVGDGWRNEDSATDKLAVEGHGSRGISNRKSIARSLSAF